MVVLPTTGGAPPPLVVTSFPFDASEIMGDDPCCNRSTRVHQQCTSARETTVLRPGPSNQTSLVNRGNRTRHNQLEIKQQLQ